jgi:hypothetical protein
MGQFPTRLRNPSPVPVHGPADTVLVAARVPGAGLPRPAAAPGRAPDRPAPVPGGGGDVGRRSVCPRAGPGVAGTPVR